MKVLRTPEERFKNLPNFDYSPNYLEVEDKDLGALRIAYIDEGSKDAPVVLCMHGEPSWSFLYRKMIPLFLEAGYRVIAPDLIGFGRSDKPALRTDYTYQKHVNWMSDWLKALNLTNITLVAQDWGGFIGLRLVADMPDRFARVSISNTGLPTGDQGASETFQQWFEFTQNTEDFDCGFILNKFGQGTLTKLEQDAYRAPFPSEDYLAGARVFPALVPVTPDNPASEDVRKAQEKLSSFTKPVLLCFADKDPVSKPFEQFFLDNVPGTKKQPHTELHGFHFIQEEDGERWAKVVIDWIK
ncbi:haloalkane dehalogenase [Poseidonibacter antarcticus]|uniref:haloalkane dehalogenase n=1 Tax=Poseidonibacter antarcticus TaxID=2478538 RepID=UPI000EF48526|nr:haloalkane dehalogenase [Poseidonibacter antarcticus]